MLNSRHKQGGQSRQYQKRSDSKRTKLYYDIDQQRLEKVPASRQSLRSSKSRESSNTRNMNYMKPTFSQIAREQFNQSFNNQDQSNNIFTSVYTTPKQRSPEPRFLMMDQRRSGIDFLNEQSYFKNNPQMVDRRFKAQSQTDEHVSLNIRQRKLLQRQKKMAARQSQTLNSQEKMLFNSSEKINEFILPEEPYNMMVQSANKRNKNSSFTGNISLNVDHLDSTYNQKHRKVKKSTTPNMKAYNINKKKNRSQQIAFDYYAIENIDMKQIEDNKAGGSNSSGQESKGASFQTAEDISLTDNQLQFADVSDLVNLNQQQIVESQSRYEDSDRDASLTISYQLINIDFQDSIESPMRNQPVFSIEIELQELKKEFRQFQRNRYAGQDRVKDFIIYMVQKDSELVLSSGYGQLLTLKLVLKNDNNSSRKVQLANIPNYQTIEDFLRSIQVSDQNKKQKQLHMIAFIEVQDRPTITNINMGDVERNQTQPQQQIQPSPEAPQHSAQVNQLQDQVNWLLKEQATLKLEVEKFKDQLKSRDDEGDKEKSRHEEQINAIQTRHEAEMQSMKNEFRELLKQELDQLKQMVKINANEIKLQEMSHRALTKQIEMDDVDIHNLVESEDLLQQQPTLKKSASINPAIIGTQKTNGKKKLGKTPQIMIGDLSKQNNELVPLASGGQSLREDEIDMVFMFADPLVVDEQGRMHEYIIPLDLDLEYANIANNLHLIGKEFKLMRKAFSIGSLQDIIQKNPKILHISCHGSFKETENGKHFYISIESDFGVEYQLEQEQLKELLMLQQNMQIKLAVVSACQSEEIGRIFGDAGIPVVIAVNSNEEIADEACKVFSKKFYDGLLKGSTISEAFKMAKNYVFVSNMSDFNVCCCAHQHDDDCLWYKFYQKYPKEAHDLHSHNCQCSVSKSDAARKKHNKFCESLKRFRNFMVELEKDPNMRPKSLLYQNFTDALKQQVQKHKIEQEQQAQPKMSGLAGLVDSDDEDFAFADDLSDEAEFLAKKIVQNDDDLIMCCCKKHEPHDESMKFVFHLRDPKDWDIRLFPNRNKGALIDEELEYYHQQIPCNVDKRQILGRQTFVHKILKFITTSKQRDSKRIMAINGTKSQCGSDLAQFAVKYAQDRGNFDDGAFYIDFENKQSEQSLLRSICKKIGLLGFGSGDDLQRAIRSFQKQRKLLMIDNCDKLIEKGKIINILRDFIKNTTHLIIILITNKPQINGLVQDDQNLIEQLDLTPLSRSDAVRMMYLICKHLPHFIQEYETDQQLNEHDLFDLYEEYTPMHIHKMSALIQKKISLDEIYQNEKRVKTDNDSRQTTKNSENEMDLQLYNQIKQNHEKEIKMINVLSYAVAGLFFSDINQIIVLNQINEGEQSINFGDWQHFIECQLKNEEDQQEGHMVQCNIQHSKVTMNEFKFLVESHNEILKQNKIQVNESVAKIFRDQASDLGQNLDFATQYLQYMCLLSRDLVRKIQIQKNIEFDPYILSSLIDEGLWRPKDEFNFIIHKMQSELNQDQLSTIEKQACNLFEEHESNFIEMLEQAHEIFGETLSKPDISSYYDELCLNIPSIFYMMNRITDMQDCWHLIESICENNETYNATYGKVKLMQASIYIQQGKTNMNQTKMEIYAADELFSVCPDEIDIAAEFETNFMQAVLCIKSWQDSNKVKQQRQGQKRQGKSFVRNLTSSNSFSQYDEDEFKRFKSAGSSGFEIQQLESTVQENQLLINGLQLLTECINKQVENDLYVKRHAKVVLIYSQALVQLHKEESDIFWGMIDYEKSLISLDQLDNLLEKVIEELYDYKCFILSAECLYYHANILNILAEDPLKTQRNSIDENKSQIYLRCRKKLTRCMAQCRVFDQYKIFQLAQKLFQEVSYNIKITMNYNKFYFAKSANTSMQETNKNAQYLVLHKQIEDYYSELFDQLKEKNKQIDIVIEVLTTHFLKFIKSSDCKILHLTHNFFKTDENKQDTILVEGNNFEQQFLNPQQFKELLQPQQGEGKLNISLVLLDKIGARSFCDVLIELGVKHVVSFELKVQQSNRSGSGMSKINQNISNVKVIVDQYKQFYEASLFCFYFSQKFYPNLVSNLKVQEAINDAKNYATEQLKHLGIKNELVEVIHLTKIGRDRKLFGNTGIGENKDFEDGEICIVDDFRAMTNIEFETLKMPFMFKKDNNFQAILKIISDGQVQIDSKKNAKIMWRSFKKGIDERDSVTEQNKLLKINIYGQQGIGKTRIIKEIARFLRFRYVFQAGIFMIDCSKEDQIEKIHDLLGDRITKNKDQSQLKPQNSFYYHDQEDGTLNNQFKIQKEGILMILDNVDVYLKRNKSQFVMNISFFQQNFSNMTLICLSQNKLNPQYNFEPFQINKFDFVQSIIYVKHLNLYQRYLQFENLLEIANLSQGNPSLLNILSLILQSSHGKKQILKKVQLSPMKDLYEQFDKEIHSTFEGQRSSIMTQTHDLPSLYMSKQQSRISEDQMIDSLKNNLHKQIFGLMHLKLQKNTFENEDAGGTNKDILSKNFKQQNLEKQISIRSQNLRSQKTLNKFTSNQNFDLTLNRSKTMVTKTLKRGITEIYQDKQSSKSKKEGSSSQERSSEQLALKQKRNTDIGMKQKEKYEGNYKDFQNELIDRNINDDKDLMMDENQGTYSDMSQGSLGSKCSDDFKLDTNDQVTSPSQGMSQKIEIPTQQRRQTHQVSELKSGVANLHKLKISSSPLDQIKEEKGNDIQRRRTNKSVAFKMERSSDSSSEKSYSLSEESEKMHKQEHHVDNFFNIDGFIIEAFDAQNRNIAIEFKKSHRENDENKINHLVFFMEDDEKVDQSSVAGGGRSSPSQRRSSKLSNIFANEVQSIFNKALGRGPTFKKSYKMIKPEQTIESIQTIRIFVPNDFFSANAQQEWQQILNDSKGMLGDILSGTIIEESDDSSSCTSNFKEDIE